MCGRGISRDDKAGNVILWVHQHLLRSVAEPDGDQLIAHAVEYGGGHGLLYRVAGGERADIDRDAFEAVLRLADEIERHKEAGPVRPGFIGHSRDPSPGAEPCPADMGAYGMDTAPTRGEVDARRSRGFFEIGRIHREGGAACRAIAAGAIREERAQQNGFQVGLGVHPLGRAATRIEKQESGAALDAATSHGQMNRRQLSGTANASRRAQP